MAAISSVFWILGFTLSVLIAPQLRIWTWGPTMICFAVSTVAALPLIWNERGTKADTFLVISASALAFWIAIRAAVSPVAELAQSDFLLTAMAVATFVSFRASAGRDASQRILVYGLALILAASVWVIGKQIGDPTFSPIFPNSLEKLPAGFFAHYSYGASFLIPVSLILAAMALHSKETWPARALLGLIAVSGMGAVYFTNSRGGFVGIGAGLAAFALLTVLAGNQQRKKWFAPAIIILPFVLIVLGVLFLKWLGNIQEARSGSADMAGLLDNTVRFYLMGIAISCFGLHPFFGGGSRSFSWECFRFWDIEAMGAGGAKPEHVHNELLQTATDYGLIGAALLIFIAVAAIIVAVFRITARNTSLPAPFANPWRIGGLAGFIGLFAQSNFEGIFRIPPGAILLALCLAAMCLPTRIRSGAPRPWVFPTLISLGCIAAIASLATYGWKGAQATRILWPVYFADITPGLEARADAISSAIVHWPLGSLYKERGMTYQILAAETDTEVDTDQLLGLALKDYQVAEERHPYDPGSATSSATLLSTLGRDAEAESAFRRAISLQGGMEAGFKSNFLYAKHLYGKGLREFDSGNLVDALTSFQLAAAHSEQTVEKYGRHSIDRKLRVNIHECYGRTLEEMGDFGKALDEYDFAATLPGGSSAHYRAGVLLGKRAVHAWSERRSPDAMRLFMDARARILRAHELPPGVDEKKRNEYRAYLEKTINYLKGAKVEPSVNSEF